MWKYLYGCLMASAVAVAGGCGGGNNGGGVTVSPGNVGGVASTGAAIEGTATLKDSAGNPEASSPIASGSGSFNIAVDNRQPPFLLRADSQFSLTGGAGTANITPFTTIVVAQAGGFGNISSLNAFYANPERSKMESTFSNMSTGRRAMQQTLAPLLNNYGVASADPVTTPMMAAQGYSVLLRDVSVTIAPDGSIRMVNLNNGILFQGQLGDISAGTLTETNILPPSTVTGTTTIGTTGTTGIDGTTGTTGTIGTTGTTGGTGTGTIGTIGTTGITGTTGTIDTTGTTGGTGTGTVGTTGTGITGTTGTTGTIGTTGTTGGTGTGTIGTIGTTGITGTTGTIDTTGTTGGTGTGTVGTTGTGITGTTGTTGTIGTTGTTGTIGTTGTTTGTGTGTIGTTGVIVTTGTGKRSSAGAGTGRAGNLP